MSWAMPTTGQWPSVTGMAMTPDMNMGNYTQEQWTALQQQNWQQWAQWQQQYAQWQTQYGEKYAQQMQVMGGMPPLPLASTTAPPAPPPPDKPPPPPPHENNQPLFGNTATQPAPVPPPSQRNTNSGYNNSNFTGNNQSWSHVASDGQQETSQAVNADALKKLAEEERLFDIQFQKWEEEIEKWKKENVNHPDKEAYKEYEAKFEACRVQLLERRQQMLQRRAKLLGNPPQPASTAPTGNNKTTPAIPSLMQVPVAKPPNFNKNIQPQPNIHSHQNIQSQPNIHSHQNIQSQPNIHSHQNIQSQPNIHSHQNIQSQPNIHSHQNIQSQQNIHSHQNIQPQPNVHSHQNIQSQNSKNQQTPHNYQNQNNVSKQYNDSQGYNQSNKTNYDLKDRYEAYDTMEDYSANDGSDGNFLPASASGKGIPGLDLVPESDKQIKTQDVIDITGENARPAAPDYSTISIGINNILGDEKIMNILSMVRVTATGGNNNSQNVPSGPGGSSGPSSYSGNFGAGGPGASSGYGGPSAPSGPPSYGPNNANNYSMTPDNQWDRNDNQHNNQQQQQYGNIVPFNRQVPPPLMQQNVNPSGQNRLYNNGQRDMPQDQYYERNSQFGGPNMGPRPNMPPGRPPLQEMAGNQNMNDQYRSPLDNSGMPDGRGMHDNRAMPMHENRIPINQPPPRPKWVEDPLFTPSIIVEYEHKPLRLKAREFIEPVHTFDYNHISKDDDYKKKDFEREVDELFTRKPRRLDDDYPNPDRYMERTERFAIDRSERFRENRDLERPSRDFERRPREEIRDDFRPRAPPRDEYEDRRRSDSMYYDRRRDDRDTLPRRDDYRDREEHRSRDDYRDRDRDRYSRDNRRDDVRIRSRSRDKDSRKRARSKECEVSELSKKSKESEKAETPKHVVMIDDILEAPGRDMRPEKIVIILRGPPGSGKSYLAKLIKEREAELGGSARVMSIDDYFIQEGEIEEKDPNTGKIVKKPTMKYEYDESLEETYLNSFKRAFKRCLTNGYFSFLIYDAVNDQLKSYADIWNYARQNGFQVYIVTMDLDPQICFKRNIHNRTLGDIEVICSRFFPTPSHHIELDASTLLQNAAITDVHMEDASDDVVIMEDAQDTEELMPKGAAPSQVENSFTSKWEKMDDVDKLARLDGTSKPLRPSQLSMEDYLQIDDWKPTQAKPGKKTVRWADIEERRQQEKMRAIGFVVGQTDWHRMTDPTMGSSALTQTKYIERVKRK